MTTSSYILRVLIAAGAALSLAACENLPGTREEQATGAGATVGAAVGASVADNDLIGALLGGAAGATAGHVIGARTDWFEGDRRDEARESLEAARQNPVTAADVRDARTADVNSDGFVTMDELMAMEEAGLRESEILLRLERTQQVFDLNAEQQRTLVDAGFSRELIAEIEEINREERERVLGRSSGSDVIGQRRS